MKKTILAAIATMMLFSFSAQAQDNNNKKAEKCCKETTCKTACSKEFEGIQLTDAQKTKIQNLKAEKKAKMEAAQAKRKEMAKERKELKDSLKRQKRDFSMKNDSLFKAGKREYLTQIKEILTPDQYVVYLENQVINMGSGRMKIAKDSRHKFDKRDGRPMRDGKPAPRAKK